MSWPGLPTSNNVCLTFDFRKKTLTPIFRTACIQFMTGLDLGNAAE